MSRVLITGGAGFIGSHTADLLINYGYDVTILDCLHPKTHNGEWPTYLNPKAKKILGNVLDSLLMKNLLSESDYVIHLASEMDLNPDFKLFMDVNLGSTALIYECIVKNNIQIKKVIVASTQFVYGEGKWKCLEHGEFLACNRTDNQLNKANWDIVCPRCNNKADYIKNIETIANPPNHYALSKYFSEQLAIRLGKLHSIPSVALRYSIVHGPRQSLKNTYSGALRTFAINMLLKNQLATFEDNLTMRDFVSVFDVAEANKLVLEEEMSNYEIFNVGGDKSYTTIDLANILSKCMNIPFSFSSKIEYRPGDIRFAISESKKLKDIGWEPRYSEEDTLLQYVEWLKLQKIDFSNFLNTQLKIREIGIVKSI